MTYEGKEETQLPLVDRTKCFVFDTPINLSKTYNILLVFLSKHYKFL